MNLFDLDTPALVVDLDLLERNIARMAEIARDGGKSLRPHTKTHKTPEIAQLQVDSGASGLTVAKLGEAEVYAERGFTDIFIANEIVGAPKIERLVALAERCRVIVGVDSKEVARPISEAARARGLRVPVRIEIDTGLGRAGVRNQADAVELGKRISESAGLELEGIFTHEGYAYKVDETARPGLCAGWAKDMQGLREDLESVGLPIQSVSVGSTPTAPIMARQKGITELRPGVYVFGDVMQTGMGMKLADCALSVLATVVSRPDSATAIVDAGTKALSGDRAAEGSKHGTVIGHEDVSFDWSSEEHGHLDISQSRWQAAVGEKLRTIPYHACATVNMHDEIYAVRGETVEAVWKVAARGKLR